MAETRATPPLLKRLNERTVLEAIRDGAPISRAEIARRVGISKPTVSLALDSLLAAGLVREAAPLTSRPTYGALFFEAVPEAALVLGLDVGARFLRAALCDLRGTIRARHDVELRHAARRPRAGVARRPERAPRRRRRARRCSDRRGGRGCAGRGRPRPRHRPPRRERRRPRRAAVRLRGSRAARHSGRGLQRHQPRRARRARRGAARGVDDFVFISIGTGLGAGLVLRGELHRGHHGAAGELDYVSAGIGEEIDPCAAALSATAERLAAGRTTALAPPYAGPEIFAAAAAGDEVAREVVAEEARRIALHVVPVAAVTDVGLVVLGGGIGANTLLLDEIRPLLARLLPYPPRVEISSLGDAAVLGGALSVGLDAALENVFVNRPVRLSPAS